MLRVYTSQSTITNHANQYLDQVNHTILYALHTSMRFALHTNMSIESEEHEYLCLLQPHTLILGTLYIPHYHNLYVNVMFGLFDHVL